MEGHEEIPVSPLGPTSAPDADEVDDHVEGAEPTVLG